MSESPIRLPVNSLSPGGDARSLAAILDALPGGIAHYDRDLICRYANKAYRALYGFDEWDVVGAHVRIITGDTVFALNAPYHRAVLRGEPQTFERALPRADGSASQILARYVPDFGPDGRVTGFYAMLNDVTPLKSVELALRQSRDELDSMLARSREVNAGLEMAEQVARIGHWRVSLPDMALTWSEGVYRIHGVDPASFTPTVEAAIGFYHPDDREAVRTMLLRTASDGEPFDFVRRIVLADGTTRHVQGRGARTGRDRGARSAIFGVFADVTDQCMVEKALRDDNVLLGAMAFLDGLTGIPNRRRFDEALDRAVRSSERNHEPLSVVLIDVDRFKTFNDRYGHMAGDDCLRAIAGALVSAGRRPHDLVARFGGEELAILLPATDKEGAREVAERALQAIRDLRIPHAGNEAGGGFVSASMGVATAMPSACGGEATGAGLVAVADRVLYAAKRRGRNRMVASLIDAPSAGSVRDMIDRFQARRFEAAPRA